MLVFDKAKLVLLSVPKTGTTSYEQELAPYSALAILNPPELKHAPVYRYNRFVRPMLEKFVGTPIDVMAVMREPVSWLGSWYRYRQRPHVLGTKNSTLGIDFDDFVLEYMKGNRLPFANVGSQAKFLEPSRNGTEVTHLFRYEDQPKILDFLENRLDRKISLPRLNVSPPMELCLSPKVSDKLRRKCHEEFDLWDSIDSESKIF